LLKHNENTVSLPIEEYPLMIGLCIQNSRYPGVSVGGRVVIKRAENRLEGVIVTSFLSVGTSSINRCSAAHYDAQEDKSQQTKRS
jgi:hypothetical protein